MHDMHNNTTHKTFKNNLETELETVQNELREIYVHVNTALQMLQYNFPVEHVQNYCRENGFRLEDLTPAAHRIH